MSGGHSYNLRAVPEDVFRRAQRRAYAEGRRGGIRWVLIRALERYADGLLNLD